MAPSTNGRRSSTTSSDSRPLTLPEEQQHSDDTVQQDTSTLPSLIREVRARKAEYIRPRTIRIKVGTWNVAALSGTEKDIENWFVEGKDIIHHVTDQGRQYHNSKQRRSTSSERSTTTQARENLAEKLTDEVGLYVLGLQEIVDLSSPAVTLSPFNDPVPSTRWKNVVQEALPAGYQLVAESQLVGLLLLVYAAPNVAPTITSVSSTTVGTGIMGMGNKGATITRLVLGETTRLVFVNCHLAAGSDKGSLDRRNWDAGQIVSRTKFNPIGIDHELYGEPSDTIASADFAFWFGDLNYRLDDIPGEDIRRLLSLHTQNPYDAKHKHRKKPDTDLPSPILVVDSETETTEEEVQKQTVDQTAENPRLTAEVLEAEAQKTTIVPTTIVETSDPLNDPTSLLTTLNSLLSHDQLRNQQMKKKAFHEGWREGEIYFLPTYKYDVGSVAIFDTSEKQRGPSWCDRILYRSKADREAYEKEVMEAEKSRQKDEEMQNRGIDKAADDENVLDSQDGASERSLGTHDDKPEGKIKLIHYTSHQGVLSSDHKPLDAAFVLTYDAVIPDLRRQVYQEVAKELDRAENEARPEVTVVVDPHMEENEELPRDVAYDQNAIYFGGVAFGVPICKNVTIANTGSVPATFYFTSKALIDESYSESEEAKSDRQAWMDVQVEWLSDEKRKDEKKERPQKTYTFAPGDSAVAEVTVHVKDLDLVRSLNAGKVKIEEILVLRVIEGRDHFIPVYGRWLPTCFGRSLEELTHIPEAGVRSLGFPTSLDAKKAEGNVRLSAPRELFRLTEAISRLTEQAVAEWSMMKGEAQDETPPWLVQSCGVCWPFCPGSWTFRDHNQRAPFLFAAREALDNGSSLSSIFPPEVSSLPRLEILAETLVFFLTTLKDGIIKRETWKIMEQQLILRERSKDPWRSPEDIQSWVLDSLAPSPAHSVSFTFLTFMLNQIINEIAPASNPSELPPMLQPPAPPTQTDSKVPPEKIIPSISSPSRRKRTLTLSSTDSSSRDTSKEYTSTDANLTRPPDQRRKAVELGLSSLFSNLMISPGSTAPSREKERRAWEERKRLVVEAFLQPVITPNVEHRVD
ncbi:phosphatase family protein [Talaromyces stipitatus ATCC 10500]|uniref:Phosphatase family protein n=1 Tax=Talaromyces stipitatus (strain ATCC 10500 / CBS 375.48 / QM 6759 / NRRL 1006) TaxID=441959 RepID=B8MQ12_TALSN|nr:phosphatase family protein [Talaromyces stipitatus ATCC 10500]EED12902.1 phosphatase family protein [Talaromyces stipitatus ATCC 10500]